MKKILFISATLILLLNGCVGPSGYSTAKCSEKQYKGIVVSLLQPEPSISCSNGDISPDGNHYVTNRGDKHLNHYVYLEFKDTIK